MMVATIMATAKDVATRAILTTIMATETIVKKAAKTKIGDDIPMTRISLANYMEERTVLMSA